jgi:hypothetical protein
MPRTEAEFYLQAGMYEWWMRETQKEEVKAKLPELMRNRENCKHGRR